MCACVRAPPKHADMPQRKEPTYSLEGLVLVDGWLLDTVPVGLADLEDGNCEGGDRDRRRTGMMETVLVVVGWSVLMGAGMSNEMNNVKDRKHTYNARCWVLNRCSTLTSGSHVGHCHRQQVFSVQKHAPGFRWCGSWTSTLLQLSAVSKQAELG